MDNIKNLKILCTGNPEFIGIANSIKKEFPDSQFISRSNGYDLTSDEGQNKFKSMIKNFDIFVNLSYIARGIQEKLLRITHQEWDSGYVFNIGSIAEYKRWENYDIEYANEKRNLREASLDLLSKNFKTTHIVVGGFQDYDNSSPERMNPDEVVKIIKYILESSVHIPLVGIEKIIDNKMGKISNG